MIARLIPLFPTPSVQQGKGIAGPIFTNHFPPLPPHSSQPPFLSSTCSASSTSLASFASPTSSFTIPSPPPPPPHNPLRLLHILSTSSACLTITPSYEDARLLLGSRGRSRSFAPPAPAPAANGGASAGATPPAGGVSTSHPNGAAFSTRGVASSPAPSKAVSLMRARSASPKSASFRQMDPKVY